MQRAALLAAVLACAGGPAWAQHWSTVWAGSAQGPYPAGVAVGGPDLAAAFPKPELGSHDQTFRMIVKPDAFAAKMRFRLSNAFGAKPVTFDTAFAGLQMSGAAEVPGTSRKLTFAGKAAVTVPAGGQVWTDAVSLPFVHDPVPPELAGRHLAVTFHVAGDSGPMTWHATAMTTSYITSPGAGAIGEFEDEAAFPASTASWFFLDAVDAALPVGTRVVVALGDSITDGVASTLNGDDRWTDVLSRRLHAAYSDQVVVVNAGINGNQLLGPANYAADRPSPNGPSASARLDRDVLGLSGVSHVIVAEGLNDLGSAGATPDAVRDGLQALVQRLHAAKPAIRAIGATLTSTKGAKGDYGLAELNDRRQALNGIIRKPGLFDAVADFDAAASDPQTGELRSEFVPNSAGGPGDKVHPNRAGYLSMGDAVELALLAPPFRPKPKPRPVVVPKPDEELSPSERPVSAQ